MTVRRLVPALLLAACTGASPQQPPAPKTRPAPTPAPTTATEPAKAEPTPAAAPGQPYRKAGDPAAQLDAFTFWGWSKDGRYFAFETAFAGAGATTCEGEIDLFVVDATTDGFAEDGRLEIKHKQAEAQTCDPPDLQAAMDAQRPTLLRKFGIEPGYFTPPVEPAVVSVAGDTKKLELRLPSGKTATAELTVLHGGRDKVVDDSGKSEGAAFKLTLQVGTDPAVTVEKGERRRPFVWDYDLARGLAFFSHDGKRVALFTATIQLSFEGDRTSYMANGLMLPAGW